MKIKKIGALVLGFIMTFGFMMEVGATTTSTSDKIKMPYYLYINSDNYVVFDGLDGSSKYYQIFDVTDINDVKTRIDSIDQKLITLADNEANLKNYASGSDEYNNTLAAVEFAKTEIDDAVKDNNFKTLVPNYDDTAWKTMNNNLIPTTDFVEGHYYIVWIKATTGTTPYYQYHPYKAVKTGNYGTTTYVEEDVENPETGIGTTLLYVGAAVAIVMGSCLVINKNKESY